ncbi:MAG: nitrile hydratase [Lachnospiraceae bacterium]|jgi:hypothetical protein|nr:nitrile hydratase [Lachnospiraceae bacterium]
MNRLELQEKVMEKAMQDEAFRASLLKDPKGTIKKEFDITLPDNFTVKTLEEDASSITLFVPPYQSELSDENLDNVAGGICVAKIGPLCPIQC